MRADARRNHDQLVATARAIFLADGTGTPMEEIARRAAVGVGTLYRHFPDRDALVRAVALDSIQHLVRAGLAARREEADPWKALRRFLHSGGEHRLALALVRPVLLPTVRQDRELLDAGQTWYDLLAGMVERAQAQGRLRSDVGPGDIALALGQLTRPIAGLDSEIAAHLPARLIDLLLDGLQARDRTPLPGGPIAQWWVVPS